MDIRPIRTEADHAAAVRRMEALWEAAPGTPEDDELDVLATLVDAYERQRWPIEACSPVDAIRFSMEQNDRSQRDLAELLGSRSRASEILSGRRGLTLEQIKLLHVRWHIPLEALLGQMADV